MWWRSLDVKPGVNTIKMDWKKLMRALPRIYFKKSYKINKLLMETGKLVLQLLKQTLYN